jgi:hypothetical protein
MALNSITEQVLRQVHDLTGRPVVVDSDPTMKLIASSKIARGSAAAHVISYNPSMSANADYAICFQCGFILRMFALPLDQRFELSGSFRGRKDVEKMLAEHIQQSPLSSLPKEVRNTLRDQIFDGLLRQLRSVPIGLRIDSWLNSSYPELAEQQRAIITRQLKENMAALGPEVRKFAPSKIFNANTAMNSAFALYWSRLWSDLTQLSPYKAIGSVATGEQLLKLFDEIPSDPQHDRQLIEAWGADLGLSGWTDFVAAGA